MSTLEFWTESVMCNAECQESRLSTAEFWTQSVMSNAECHSPDCLLLSFGQDPKCLLLSLAGVPNVYS